MGGETPDRASVTGPEEATALLRQKLAKVRLALGVPAAALCVFVVLLAYRSTGKSLANREPWLIVAGILAGFGVYFAHALRLLKKKRT